MEARSEIPIHQLGSLEKFCSDMPCITLSISGRSPDHIADLLQTISAAKMETVGSRVSTKGAEKFIDNASHITWFVFKYFRGTHFQLDIFSH